MRSKKIFVPVLAALLCLLPLGRPALAEEYDAGAKPALAEDTAASIVTQEPVAKAQTPEAGNAAPSLEPTAPNVEKSEEKAQTAKPEADALLDSRRISINLASCSLALYEGQKKIRLYPIGPGKPQTPTPVGYFEILEKDVNPVWTDPEDPENSIPSGDSNPLGYRWMQFHGNYGIHGTNRPESVGGYVSNGCVRMHEKDVEALFDLVKVGTPVEITYNRVVVEKTPEDVVALYIYPDGYGRQPLDVAGVTEWLKGFGVQNFLSDEEIEAKIAASDGEPTYIGKVYNVKVNGKTLKNKAVVQEGITYLSAIDLADATGIALGYDAPSDVLISTYGRAIGYNKKDVLYCNADDVATLFHLDGGLDGKEGFVYQKAAAKPVVQQETATAATPADAAEEN